MKQNKLQYNQQYHIQSSQNFEQNDYEYKKYKKEKSKKEKSKKEKSQKETSKKEKSKKEKSKYEKSNYEKSKYEKSKYERSKNRDSSSDSRNIKKRQKKIKFFEQKNPLLLFNFVEDDNKVRIQRIEDEKSKLYKYIGSDKRRITKEENVLDKLVRLRRFYNYKKNEIQDENQGNLNSISGIKFFLSKDLSIDEEELEFQNQINRESRYYEKNQYQFCRRCKQPGHFEKTCTNQNNKKELCLFCLSQEHYFNLCNSGVECFRCLNSGHKILDCEVNSSQIIIKCDRCNKKGHHLTECNVIIANQIGIDEQPLLEKRIQCIKCGLQGHQNCQFEKYQIVDNLFQNDLLLKNIDFEQLDSDFEISQSNYEEGEIIKKQNIFQQFQNTCKSFH